MRLRRRIFKPKLVRGFFAVGTALLLLIIVLVAAIAGGDGGDGESVAGAQPSLAAEAVMGGSETPTAEATPGDEESPPKVQETPEAPAVEHIVAGVPGAVAEARGVRITLNNTVDPWVSPSEFARDAPDPGKRFVAFDVTVEYVKEGGTHLAYDAHFRLTDAAAFAYDATFLFDLEPALECVDLAGGEKTRGWIGFEVNEAAQLDLLKYDPDIYIPNDIEFRFE